MRLVPRSLYGRMLLASAAATLCALVVAGLVIGGVLSRFVTEGLDRRLDAQVLVLMSAVDEDGHVDRERLRTQAAAMEAGPGWRWRIAGPGGTIGSSDFPVLAEPPLPPPGPRPPAEGRLRPAEGASEEGVALHAREVTIATRAGPVTLTAAAPRAVVERPIRGALMPLLAALAALMALLTAAMVLQLRIGLRPLRRLQADVAAIRAGRLDHVGEDQPAELRPLAVELNALAADRAAALASARLSAANLAHALKTPVATLALELEGQSGAAALVAQIDRTIRHHLARARAAVTNRRSVTSLGPAVRDLAEVVRRLHRASGLTIAVTIADELAVAVDPQDLDEMLGNLLDNAARHAGSSVAVSAVREGRLVRVEIVDDGPGIAEEDRLRLLKPGMRLDERGDQADGHGFGLSIAAELAQLYGGTLALSGAPGGGLAVTLLLPAA